MSELLIILAVLFCFVAAYALLLWEKKSHKWYTDRACLFTAGLFFGLGLAGIGMGIYLITA